MSASVKKNKPKSDKVATTNDHFFCQKKKSISEPNFTKSEGKIRFGQILFWKWSSRWAEKDATKQKVIYFQEIGQKRKMVI